MTKKRDCSKLVECSFTVILGIIYLVGELLSKHQQIYQHMHVIAKMNLTESKFVRSMRPKLNRNLFRDKDIQFFLAGMRVINNLVRS